MGAICDCRLCGARSGGSPLLYRLPTTTTGAQSSGYVLDELKSLSEQQRIDYSTTMRSEGVTRCIQEWTNCPLFSPHLPTGRNIFPNSMECWPPYVSTTLIGKL